jgi:hypothetical protein
MILSDSDKSALISDPSSINTLYGNEWQDFAQQMGAADANGDLSDPLLASAFAAIAAYELKPYGNEPVGVTDLHGLLTAPALACDDYVRLTLSLMQQMPETASVDIEAIGSDNGAVGNHSQMFVSDGNETLLLDPTIGLIVRHTSYDNIMQGVPTTDFASFFEAPPAPDPWQMRAFNCEVINAVENGLYQPGDAIYRYNTLQEFNTAGLGLTPAEAEFSQALIHSGALTSQTPFSSVISFISDNTDLFEAAAADFAQRPAMQNEAQLAVEANQRPVVFALNAPSIGEPVGREANLIAAQFATDGGSANLIGSVLTLGGLAAACDNLTGGQALQNMEHSLAPSRLATFYNAVA